jgi:hypothetical protein
MTDAERTFVRVDDGVLIRTIGRARQRLVFIAPGVRKKVADALASAMDVIPPDAIHFVVDVDSEVVRLGYGTLAGLEVLQSAADSHKTTLNHHPGIRIGLLIADDTTLIYSPTPLLIEAGSNQPSKPNAIMLTAELPKGLADACAIGEEQHATLQVGKDPVDARKLDEVKRELEERPPKKFNVAKIELVFSSLLHYVEFRIEDYKLTTRSMLLKPHLFGLKNEDIVRRLTSRFKLFAESDSLTVEVPAIGSDGKPQVNEPKQKFGPLSVDRERNRIKKRFVIEAGEFGSLILRRDVPEFEKEVTVLRAKLQAYRDAVQEELKKRTNEIVAELLAGLKERLKTDPPDQWRSRFLQKEPTDADVKRLFEEDVRGEVDRVKTDFAPKIFTAYKDVTYQTFKDETFRRLMEEHFGKEAIDRIFSEHDAAPEDAGE